MITSKCQRLGAHVDHSLVLGRRRRIDGHVLRDAAKRGADGRERTGGVDHAGPAWHFGFWMIICCVTCFECMRAYIEYDGAEVSHLRRERDSVVSLSVMLTIC